MPGQMIQFATDGAPATGYLALPDAAGDTKSAAQPGVVVLHAWWGLTEPFREVCDRLAAAGFMALAPDLYHGETAETVERAEALGAALDQKMERWRGDIAGALRYLRQNGATGPLGIIGFSLGGAYALDTSVNRPEEISAVVVFYDTYPGLEYNRASAPYLCHYAEDDSFVSTEAIAQMERELQAAGRPVTISTYPGTKHWFFEANRPDAYDAAAAALAWERTVAFLNAGLRRS